MAAEIEVRVYIPHWRAALAIKALSFLAFLKRKRLISRERAFNGAMYVKDWLKRGIRVRG